MMRSVSAEPQQLPAGHVIAEKYRVDGVLGRGGMGTVYAARDLTDGSSVAVKVLAPGSSPTQRERLMREAQAAGRIAHLNVVKVFDVGEDADGNVYLVLERLQGMPLSTAMMGGPLAERDAIGLLMPVLRGVHAAHRVGVIHRDLKPENIFLVDRGAGGRDVKVLDFGISKLAGVDIQLTATGVVLGTPVYMAPEQLKGGKLDGRCDQYALACLLYEMIEGAPPFEAEDYPALAAKKLAHEPRPYHLPVDRGLRRVIDKAMAPRPEKRFEDLAAFGRALEPFAGGIRFGEGGLDWSGKVLTQSRAGSETLVMQRPLAQPKRPWLLALGAVACLGLGIAAASWLLGPDEQAEVQGDASSPPLAAPQLVDPQPVPPDVVAEAEAPALEPEPEAAEAEPTEVVAEVPGEAIEVAEEPEPQPVRRRRRRRRRPRSGSLSIDDF